MGAMFGFAASVALGAMHAYGMSLPGPLILFGSPVAGFIFVFDPLPGLLGFLAAAAGNALFYACGGAMTGSAMASLKRFGPNQCQSCGYDLTGNVSGVCPECGNKVTRLGLS